MESNSEQPTKAVHVIGKFLLVVGLIVFFGGGIYGAYNALSSKINSLERQLDATDARVATTREFVASLIDGNQLLWEHLAQEEALREETLEVVQEVAAERELLTSQLELLESELTEQKEKIASSIDVSSVITEWSKRVGRVECMFTLTDGRRARSVGSAVATYDSEGLLYVTNKHVLTGNKALVPDECSVTMADGARSVRIPKTGITTSSEKDLGWLSAGTSVPPLDSVPTKLTSCNSKPAIGDELIILGFPSVGSMTSVTATEGIISGFDEGMYVTSAKIERGNSGGAAVHLKNNCFLGIPTLVVVGKIESLARILPL